MISKTTKNNIQLWRDKNEAAGKCPLVFAVVYARISDEDKNEVTPQQAARYLSLEPA